MDFMEKITELRAKKGQLLTQAQALVDEGKIEEANELTGQMEAINTSIAGQGQPGGREARLRRRAPQRQAQGRGQGRGQAFCLFGRAAPGRL